MKTILEESTKEEIRLLMEEIGVEFCEREDGNLYIGSLIKVKPTRFNLGKSAEFAFSSALLKAMR